MYISQKVFNYYYYFFILNGFTEQGVIENTMDFRRLKERRKAESMIANVNGKVLTIYTRVYV